MAGFYNSYISSANQSPGAKGEDELLPQPIPDFLPNLSTFGAGGPQAQTGAKSPASQIQTTGNTGMQAKPAPGGGTTSPSPQSTTGTPSSATGSGLPAYGSNWNFNWQGIGGAPGATTQYQAPLSLAQMGVDFSKIPNYNPGMATPGGWQAPEGNSSAAHTALNSLLSGDASGMDTSAIKNRLKEQRLQMEGDELASARQGAASRGMLDSGMASADERRIRSSARGDILGGFRDVDIAAADAGVRNKLLASEALNSLLTGDTNRADTGFDNALAHSQFIDEQNRFGAQFGLEKTQAEMDAALALENLGLAGAGQNLESWQAGTNAQLASQGQEIEIAKGKTTELLGRLGLAVDLEQIAAGSSRDKMQFLTDIFRVLVQQEQFNAQMGLNYNQLGMNMNEILASVAKSIGA